MNKVSITTENTNSKLIINHPIVAESMEITSDMYINGAEYTPVGSLLTYAGLTAPTGWLFCNGSEVSKSLYPRLFAVIGNLYGTPANSSNFVLPNLAERIPVGKSNSNSVANSGGNSSITLSVGQLPSHTHAGTTDANGTHTHTGTTDAEGTHSHSVYDPGHTHSVQDAYFAENRGNGQNVYGTSAGTDSDNDYITRNINTGNSYTGVSIYSAGSHVHTFTSQNAGSHSHTFTTGSTGNGDSIDIRNKFIVMNYMIRY
jgi:microcystin-dependent protein